MPESVKGLENWRVTERRPDPDQERAIRHTAGAAQVFAGPGSGKTYVTVHRIKYLIEHHGADPAHILVITFTKAAAREMQERFFRLMEPDRPSVKFGTFHAVFYHILKQSSQYRGYTIITEAEKKKLIHKIIRMHKRFANIQEEDIEEVIACINNINICSSALGSTSGTKPPSIQNLTMEDMAFLSEEYDSFLNEFKQMDFDGIVRHCRNLLRDDPGILSKWQRQFTYIMIDEFQDISPDQYELVNLLALPENNLFVVGDDDQSIYGFRGASPACMQIFMRDHPDARRMFLNTNYRCNVKIVEAAGRVIEENADRVKKKIKAVHDRGDGLRLNIFENAQEQERFLTGDIKCRQNAGRLKDCAMICRTNYDCAMWAQTLKKNHIPFIVKEKPANPYEHFVIRDIMAYLALAQGQMYRRHMLRIMNRPVRYLKRASLSEETVSEKEMLTYYHDAPVLQQEVRRLFHDIGTLRGRKLYLQIHYIRNVIGYDKYLHDKYGMEKAAEYIRIADGFQKLSEEFCSYEAMKDYISQYSVPEDAQPGKMEDGLYLMTMHASKGLEFDTVYLPDCQEGKIPSARSDSPEETEEERRMLYVAMTRAKKELCITAYKGKGGKDMPSRFLKCLCQSSSPTSSSNSDASRYSSKASATASYSSSSSI